MTTISSKEFFSTGNPEKATVVSLAVPRGQTTQPPVPGKTMNPITNTVDAAKEGVKQFGSGFKQIAEGAQNKNLGEGLRQIGRGALNEVSGGLSTIFSPFAGLFKSAANVPVGEDKTVGSQLHEGVDQIVQAIKVSDNPAVQKFAMENPNAEEILGNIINIVGAIAGGNKAPEIRTAIKETAAPAITAVETAAAATKNAAGDIIEPVINAGKSVKNAGEMILDSISRVPDRMATNIAEKQATREAIGALPTKAAQRAAQDGIEIPDVEYLYKIPAEQKPALRKLAEVTKQFAKGETKTNPIEVVGKPIADRVQKLESERTRVGQELGEVANNLGNVTADELVNPVFQTLQKVPGLKGLKLTNEIPKDVGDDFIQAFVDGDRAAKGNLLDFSDTVLSTSLTKSDRVSIQKIFDEAIAPSTGKKKHLLRQELFEVLDGKKRSLTNLTGTEEKAFNAIRQALSDVLESKNDKYKALSNDYRKIAQPLTDLRKYVKNVANADEDILDMSYGLLARRLTSNAKTNPEIRAILRALDDATKTPGKTTLNIENLQDFYNLLDKYYDIAGKTGLQNQVREGVEKATGIKDMIVGAVKDVAGKSEAVRMKALEDALAEALK